MSDAADLAALEHDLEAELHRRSLAAFVERFWPLVTGAPLVPNLAITAVVDVLQRVADGDVWRVLIAMPPGVGKSTMLNLYAAWRLARDPSHRAIHMMHASSLADTESRKVRRLVEGDAFRAMFPAVRLRTDESTVAAWATTADGRYFAVGRDTALLGRRAKELVIDDPADVSDRFSRAAKESLWTWFGESALTRLDGDRAPVIVVHQRTGLDDLIGKLLESEPDVWTLVVLPAEFEDGTLLAPSVLGREKLDGLKLRPRAYKTMYLQQPDGDDGAIARSAWRFHAIAEANPLAPRPMGCASPEDAPTLLTPFDFDATVISIDPTFGGTKNANDFCAIQVWSSAGPRRFLRARWTKRAPQREQRAQLKAFDEEFPGAIILIEKSAGGDGYFEELTADGFTNLVLIVATTAKAARLDNVSPTIDNGLAVLPLGLAGLAEFVECLAGATAHDDDQDAASQAIHWLNVHSKTLDARSHWNALSGATLAAHRAAVAASAGPPRNTSPEQLAELVRLASEISAAIDLELPFAQGARADKLRAVRLCATRIVRGKSSPGDAPRLQSFAADRDRARRLERLEQAAT